MLVSGDFFKIQSSFLISNALCVPHPTAILTKAQKAQSGYGQRVLL